MGDNIYLGDRNGVRTPMQWSADRNAGFSRAISQKLYLPVIYRPGVPLRNDQRRGPAEQPEFAALVDEAADRPAQAVQGLRPGRHRVPAPRTTTRCWRSSAVRGRDGSWWWRTSRGSPSRGARPVRASRAWSRWSCSGRPSSPPSRMHRTSSRSGRTSSTGSPWSIPTGRGRPPRPPPRPRRRSCMSRAVRTACSGRTFAGRWRRSCPPTCGAGAGSEGRPGA